MFRHRPCSAPGFQLAGLRGLAAVVLLSGCGPARPTAVPPEETPAECEARKQGLVRFVEAASARGVASPSRILLPESTLGAVPGSGHLLEIGARELLFDGEPVTEATDEAKLGRFRSWVGAFAAEKAGGPRPVLYVAAEPALEIRALRTFLSQVPESVALRLLVRTRTPREAELSVEGTEAARRLAKALWLEPDAAKRRELATAGYDAHGDCPALESAVSEVSATGPSERWPVLQQALLRSLPSCSCDRLDTASLRLVVGAELRAGAVSLGWVPLDFLRDPRCDASMPLRAVQKLVRQIEEFDAEFSGKIGEEATSFEDVLVSDRLRVYFCDALPGELLAAKQRARSTIHFRVPGLSSCDTFAFEPLATGSPMGTLRRASSSPRPPLAFHYWQGAEEIRLFGPLDPAVKSLPTDARDYPCSETFRFQSVDEHAISLDGGGRWFMSADACAASTESAARTAGCVASVAAGVTPPAP